MPRGPKWTAEEDLLLLALVKRYKWTWLQKRPYLLRPGDRTNDSMRKRVFRIPRLSEVSYTDAQVDAMAAKLTSPTANTVAAQAPARSRQRQRVTAIRRHASADIISSASQPKATVVNSTRTEARKSVLDRKRGRGSHDKDEDQLRAGAEGDAPARPGRITRSRANQGRTDTALTSNGDKMEGGRPARPNVQQTARRVEVNTVADVPQNANRLVMRDHPVPLAYLTPITKEA